jgi:hypothetical protein
MIVTEIYNGQGHGNQLFCYVTTRCIALDRGLPFGIMHPERMKSANFMNLDFGLPVTGGSTPREGAEPSVLPDGITHYYVERKIDIDAVDVRPYDEHLPLVPDNSKIDGLMQDVRYFAHRKDEVREWLRVRPEFECLDYASDDICVIYLRGGEISRYKSVFLRKQYWDDAIANMRKINPDFRFVVVTDDDTTAKEMLPGIEILRFGVEKDYAILNSAHYVITANSSFGIFPLWLNERLKVVIAPKYWAAHNESDGYWSLAQNIVPGWTYQDRDSNLSDSETCRKELAEYTAAHPERFVETAAVPPTKKRWYELVAKIPALMQYFTGKRDMRGLWTRPEMRHVARLRDLYLRSISKAKKLRTRAVFIFESKRAEHILKNKHARNPRLSWALSFPLLDSDALQAKCDYSFGDHSGVIGRVPGAYMKKANNKNTEFVEAVQKHAGGVMTLFIDNVRLYRRPLPFHDWLKMKPIGPSAAKWLEQFADEDLLELCSEFPEQQFIIFTALEDNPLDERIEGRIPENVLAIHAANAVYFGGKVHPYPHGLERRMYPGHNHQTILRLMLLEERAPEKLLYVNHRNDTGARGSLYSLFSGKPWATVSPRTDYYRYLSGIQNAKFVLCPSGNGIESARNWETLYLRRVPVFKRHPYLEEMFKDFPALFVDDYTEVTEELLKNNEHLYDEAQKTDMDKLSLDSVFSKRTNNI